MCLILGLGCVENPYPSLPLPLKTPILNFKSPYLFSFSADKKTGQTTLKVGKFSS